MKKKKKMLLRYSFVYYLMIPFVKAYYYILLKKYLSKENHIKYYYFKHFKKYPDLENPKTLNEKVNWMKLYHTDENFHRYSDKYRVRSFIAEVLGEEYLIPLYFETDNPKEICPDNLPDYPCIIKTNHDSSGGIIIENKNDFSHNWQSIRNILRFNMTFNYYWNGRETQYKNIKPHIVVEKLLKDEDGNIPADFKHHYFNGKLAMIQVDSDRLKGHKRNLYDAHWEPIPCSWEYPVGELIEKPQNFSKMVALGEKIAKDFVYLRVDFYSIKDKIYFGELTFHPDGGVGRFKPEEFDRKLGDLLILPN